MDYVYCDSQSNKLIDCPTGVGIGQTSCGYDEIAGVFCPCKYRQNDY